MNMLAAFLLGLAGSLHCAVMCGPLLLAVNAARKQGGGNSSVLHNLAYHGGRLFTYGCLGVVSGLIGAAFVLAGFQRWLSILGGVAVLLGALTSLRGKWSGRTGRWVLALKSRFGRLLGRSGCGSTVLLGTLNGLLPCGLVYVACAAAATAGGPSGGAITMLAFGAGTLPMLVSIGVAGKLASFGNPLRWRRVVLSGTAAAGLLLILRGLSLGIPYLSPHYSEGKGPVCQCQQHL